MEKLEVKSVSNNQSINLKNRVKQFQIYITNKNILKQFEYELNGGVKDYINSIINLVSSNSELIKCSFRSIVIASLKAAKLNIDIDPMLGYISIFADDNIAKFNLNYKGYIQIALRSGLFRTIDVEEVYNGELVKWDESIQVLNLNKENHKSDEFIGCGAYFELLNGYTKVLYMDNEKLRRISKQQHDLKVLCKSNFKEMSKVITIRELFNKLICENLKTNNEELNYRYKYFIYQLSLI